MSPVLDAALAFHHAGICVIPAAANGTKQPWPDGPRWKQYQAGRPTEQQLEAWFANEHPGLGIVCGAVSGGIDMLEFEGRAVTEGYLEQARTVAEAAGIGDTWRRLTAGYMEISPSGGLHFPYRIIGAPVPANTKLAERPAFDLEVTAEERARISDEAVKGRDWWPRRTLMETRGEGGFTVVAPSSGPVHPTGKPWGLVSGSPATIPVLTAAEHTELYRVIRSLDQMPAPATDPFTQPGRPDRQLPDGDLKPGEDYAQRTDWADILKPAGWHLVTTAGTVRSWRRPGKDRGVSATTGRPPYDNLYVFSTSTEFDPLTPISKFRACAVLHHGGDYSAAARALRAAGYGTPLPEPVIAFAQPAVPGPGAPAEEDWWTELAARHQVIDWQQLWDDTPEDEDWIVEPVIAAGRSIALYSPPKTGKSLLVLEIAAAVTTGNPVLGQAAGKRRRVLYVDLENSRRDLRDRLTDLGYKPADLEDLAYLSFPSLPALDSAQGGREILALAITHKAELVIIDTVSRVISGGENDADTFAALYRFALAPLKGRGIAVIRIDHSGKDMSRGQRGSSAKNADVDSVWFLSGTGTHLTLRCEMTRTAIEAPSINLRRLKDPLRHEVTASGDQVPDRVQVLMAKLDELGVPRTDGRMRCQKALNAAGVPVDTNALAAAVKTRRLQPDLSEWTPVEQADQTGSADRSDLSGASQTGSGKTPGQTCLPENQTGSDRSFRGEPGATVWSGDPPLGGPAQTGADTGPQTPPQIHACPRCFAPVPGEGELCPGCSGGGTA